MPELTDNIQFPPDCTGTTDKYHYSIYAQEQLRLVHNLFGKWHREGITKAEWDEIWTYWADATDIKKAYPYHEGLLSDELWKKFLDEVFNPRSMRVSREVSGNRSLLKASCFWMPKMEDL